MDKKGTLLLLLIGFVGLMDCLDGTIVAVALPTIASDMGVDVSTASWVSVAYFMMMAGTLILFGRIAKNTSIRLVLLSGIAVFATSSLACGMSSSFMMLIVSRIAQGIGAAMMGATIPMCCVRFFPAHVLGYALAVVTIGYSVGAAIGPALGGILVSSLSWHWIFYINVPIGIILILLLHIHLPEEERDEEKVKVDYLGATTLFIAIVGLVFLFENLGDRMIMVASGVVFITFITAFALHEIRADEPLLSLSIFRHSAYNLSILVYFLVNVVYMGLAYLLPFYMSVSLGFDSTKTGLFLFIPALITMIVGMPIGRWSDRVGRKWFCVASCLMLALAMVIFAFMDDLNMPLFVLALVCMGMMWAFAGGPMCSRVIECTVGESKEMGSTMLNESAYLGSTIGTVLFAAMFTALAGAGGVPIDMLTKDVFMDGFTITMLIGAAISFVSGVFSLIVKDNAGSSEGQ